MTTLGKVRSGLPISMAPPFNADAVGPHCGVSVKGHVLTEMGVPREVWQENNLRVTGRYCNRLPHPETEPHASVNTHTGTFITWGGE